MCEVFVFCIALYVGDSLLMNV